MYDEGMTTDRCDRHRLEVSVAAMSIEAETEALTDTMVVDGVDQDHHLEEMVDIGAEALEAATWMTKPTLQSREEILETFRKFK